MFTDIDGFTAIFERFSQVASRAGAEELTKLLDRFLAILIKTTREHGGDLQKLGGTSEYCCSPAKVTRCMRLPLRWKCNKR